MSNQIHLPIAQFLKKCFVWSNCNHFHNHESASSYQKLFLESSSLYSKLHLHSNTKEEWTCQFDPLKSHNNFFDENVIMEETYTSNQNKIPFSYIQEKMPLISPYI